MFLRLSPTTTPDQVPLNMITPSGLPVAPTQGAPFMHPVRGAFGCIGCNRQMNGLGDFSSWWSGMSTTGQLLTVLLGIGGIYGTFKIAKKVMR